VNTRPANVTIRDVASLAGVSPMTVSRVINASDRVSPETQRRVQEAIADLGYIPSRLARSLSGRRTGTLAVIVPDVANPFFTLIVRAAEEVARRSSYRVILCDTRADLAVERDVIEELIAHRVEGIVIAPVSDRSKPHLARLARFGVPFGLGHRRIGLIVEADEVSTARERRRGYESALRTVDLPLDPALAVEATPDPEGGFDGMGRLLSADDPPSAVFAVNNLVALGAIEAVRAAGLEVPDDVALVCFDDIELASRLYPFLTALEQPAETFGTLGTQVLLERIHGRGSRRDNVVVLPGRLTVRRSCGARNGGAV
jgi:LacI family transcriptional regulator